MANEKRLIDANDLIDWLSKYTGFRGNCENCTDIDCLDCIIENAIQNAPTVDAVEVVRCKDCTRYKKGYCTIRKDGWGATLMVGMTDYCSDGERKDNEQT
jgi:hypothetical protein